MFKVGDNVEVRKDVPGTRSFQAGILIEAGKHFDWTVKFNDGELLGYQESELELIIEETQGMKKADLKTGMIVQIRKGDEYKVLLDLEDGRSIMTRSDTEGWASLKDYNEDLTYPHMPDYDIVKVHSGAVYNLSSLGTLRWDALTDRDMPEVEELTMAQVCEQLGKQVKIIEG